MTIREKLSKLPSVDECLKSDQGQKWLESYYRKTVVRSIREVVGSKRKEILDGKDPDVSLDIISSDIEAAIKRFSAYKLRPLINATGIVIHTNLGRSVLSEKAIENVAAIAGRYSNLEYEISKGKRGKRYSHLKDILLELTGAEDAVVVNNNAAAVLICLDTFARGREVIVSRGELVEIGGSFRVPEVMKSSGAILREVGTTNKTHLSDYENALCGNTGLLMKVHQSNYKITGFTEESLEKYGIQGEPTVQDVIKQGADLVSFSGDKLLGGPQAGIIVGREKLVKKIQKNPMLRAMRIDKMTFAALEATFMQYLDEEKAIKDIPTVRMLTETRDIIKKRAKKILSALKKAVPDHVDTDVRPDHSRAGGGSLPEADFPTFAVSLKPKGISVNELEKKLRLGDPPVIARIKEDVLLFDARTVQDNEIKILVNCIISAFEK
jgi:L-seryl-tRNA(Ser) seleniumtransferase